MALRKEKPEHHRSIERHLGQNIHTYSYHNARNETDNTIARQNIKSKARRSLSTAKKVWLERFGFIVLAIAIVSCLISVLYLSSSPRVVIVGSSSNSIYLDSLAAVGTKASKLFSSSILNGNKITANTSKIALTLEEDFPMYSSVSITVPLIDHHPIIYLTPAQPAVMLTNTAGSYLLNENGQIMDESTSVSNFNNLKLPGITYPINQYLSINQQILTSDEVSFIQTVTYELNTKGISISTMKLPEGSAELDAYITGKPYYVKFDLENDDPRQQAGSLLATQHYLEGQGITPSQYIDVQTDGRVYYK